MNTQKLNFVYKKILEEFPDTGKILHEIGFLFILDVNSRLSLEKLIVKVKCHVNVIVIQYSNIIVSYPSTCGFN